MGADDEPTLPIALPEQPSPHRSHIAPADVRCRFCSAMIPHDEPWGLCDDCSDSAEWDD